MSEDVTAKVQAEAAKKEMEQLPQTFKARYNQKIEPTDADASGTKKKSTSVTK